MTTATELESFAVIAEQERIAWANGDMAKAATLGALLDVIEEKDDAEKQTGEAAEKLGALTEAVDGLLSDVSALQDDLAGIVDLKTKAERNEAWKQWDKQMENLLNDLRKARAEADE